MWGVVVYMLIGLLFMWIVDVQLEDHNPKYPAAYYLIFAFVFWWILLIELIVYYTSKKDKGGK